MLEIVGILGITVEGRIKEIRACIRGMIVKEFRRKKGYENSNIQKKPKGSRKVANLVSSINPDRWVGVQLAGVKLLGS